MPRRRRRRARLQRLLLAGPPACGRSRRPARRVAALGRRAASGAARAWPRRHAAEQNGAIEEHGKFTTVTVQATRDASPSWSRPDLQADRCSCARRPPLRSPRLSHWPAFRRLMAPAVDAGSAAPPVARAAPRPGTRLALVRRWWWRCHGGLRRARTRRARRDDGARSRGRPRPPEGARSRVCESPPAGACSVSATAASRSSQWRRRRPPPTRARCAAICAPPVIRRASTGSC